MSRAVPAVGGEDACTILHVDMDAFYASVVLRDHPELRSRPVVVAGGNERGVILCATYPARAHGVRSAMPVARARRLCPDLVVVSPDFGAFAQVSTSVLDAFARVTPEVEALSQEEAFLDVRGSRRHAGTPRAIAERLRAEIHDEQRITCSVGMAATRSVAKLASRRAKPDGIAAIPPEAVTRILAPLDAGDLWGVGEKTRERLRSLGLVTVGDVAAMPLAALQGSLGRAAGAHVHALALGRDPGGPSPKFAPHDRARSMGADRTLEADLASYDAVLVELLRLTVKVTSRLRRAHQSATTVSMRLRYPDRTTITRSHTLPEPSDVTHDLYAAVVGLYDEQCARDARVRPVRLVGVRLSGLRPRDGLQPQLRLGEPERGWSDADRAVDRVRERFGKHAVSPATLLG